ncbi:RNA recognition motif 2-domain-containing protein [Xylaria arbuscula]|nr:RNA recognition motif 2-domain-containing protein [Xylaria arbuscula]
MSANPSTREGHFNPTSPHSSSGAADSFKGTPETRLTTFSPDDGSATSSKASQSLSVRTQDNRLVFAPNARGTLELPSPFVRANLHSERDPFVSSSAIGTTRTPKLSPTANVFLPFPHASANGGHVIESVGQQLDGAHHENGLDQPLTRDPQQDLESDGLEMHGSRGICEDENGDRVFVRFLNIRDAIASYMALSTAYDRGWFVEYIRTSEYAQLVEAETGRQTIHEAQLYLSVFPTPVPMYIEEQRVELIMKRLLQDHGDLFAFKPEPSNGAEGSLFSAIAEYCDNETSIRVKKLLNDKIIEGGLHLCIALYRPDVSAYGIENSGVISPARTATTESDIVHSLQRLNISRPQSALPSLNNPNTLLSTPIRSQALQIPSAYGMLPILYHGIPMTTPPYVYDSLSTRNPTTRFSSAAYPYIGPMTPRSAYVPRDVVLPRQFPSLTRRQNATRISRSPYHQQTNNHNHVDVNRIREGTDVRTTIMLRNIPNKVDQAMLKRIVDESSWGKYDFMYLRIDFANDCNVGYAFINFVDPLDIIDFVSARGNQRWNCFKSDKVAEISYATIQGKDCLVQKFRNSSVMLEAAHYRPKLYYTLNGPCPDLVGQEEAFPEPDNQSKMKRSCENAEHVGLFTPNAGQHFRDEQRRRRSQFDRGTRMAEAEEFDYDAALHQSFYSS